MLRHLPILTACALCQAVTAATIYKCSEGGKLSYRDHPCRGAGTELAVPEPPPPDPDTAARLARSRAILVELEKARMATAQRAERAARQARREALGQRRRCDKQRLRYKWADEDLRRSTGAALDAARVKARRAREALALECPA